MGTLGKDVWDDESVTGNGGNTLRTDFVKDVSTGASKVNDEPVLISLPFPYVKGRPQTVHIGETSACAIIMQNTGSEPAKLWGLRILGSDPAATFTLSLSKQLTAKSDTEDTSGFLDGNLIEDRVLQPHETLTIWLSCKPRDLGLQTSILYFDVNNYRIERCVFILAEDEVSQSMTLNRPRSNITRKPGSGQSVIPKSVSISTPFPYMNGEPKSVFMGETATCAITLKNIISIQVKVRGMAISGSNPADAFTMSLLEPSALNLDNKGTNCLDGDSIENLVLQPLETLTVWLSCKPKHLGLHTCKIYFDVDGDRNEQTAILFSEHKGSPSVTFNGSNSSTRCSVSLRGRKCRYSLPEYEIPKDERMLLLNKQVPNALKDGLAKKNYNSFFKTLLIMEELHLENEIRSHDIRGAVLKRINYKLMSLKVPGLAEKRPSLAKGDDVYVKASSKHADYNAEFKGFICHLYTDELHLQFPRRFFKFHRNEYLYDVRFAFNRVNMRKLYHAVLMAKMLNAEFLFPSKINMRAVAKTPFVPLTCKLNEEQEQCVRMILQCEGGSPFVIFGPPGTGKTSTLVEAILQIYMTKKNARILVCAASNDAADHLLEKLINSAVAADIKDNEVLRLNARSRAYENVEANYISFCYSEDSVFMCPPSKALVHYRIIISTYISSSQLLTKGIGRGHFSHIFLDEAGQISEPECMVPLANLCKRETVTVLAGDPKQLGPVIHSKNAEAYGLGKSFLERLFEFENYHNEDENCVIKLVRNYRCHPSILELPSKLFYRGELLACERNTSTSINTWETLPNKDFPILFIGIQGSSERQSNDPSWFNPIEASKVIEVIMELKTDIDLKEEDIGVITPYRQQVLKIKGVLEDREMSGVKVGSVEQFQGQEREVMIISTVRSNVQHNDNKSTNSLGFLSSPRRFNVAITRAKSLLVIVGNPYIISKDCYWNKLLRYCCENNSYRGCILPESAAFADELCREDH